MCWRKKWSPPSGLGRSRGGIFKSERLLEKKWKSALGTNASSGLKRIAPYFPPLPPPRKRRGDDDERTSHEL